MDTLYHRYSAARSKSLGESCTYASGDKNKECFWEHYFYRKKSEIIQCLSVVEQTNEPWGTHSMEYSIAVKNERTTANPHLFALRSIQIYSLSFSCKLHFLGSLDNWLLVRYASWTIRHTAWRLRSWRKGESRVFLPFFLCFRGLLPV